MITTKEVARRFLDSNKPSATAAKIILTILALGVIVAVGAVAPNVFSAFGRLGYGKFSKKQVRDGLNGLKRAKLIEVIKEKNGKTIVRLTTKGGKRVRSFSLDELTIQKPRKWDRKWRIVIFDIPVFMNKARSALRATIKDLGLCQLQKSVWICPYPCEDEILFAAKFFNVENYIEIFETEYFANEITEQKLLRIFELE